MKRFHDGIPWLQPSDETDRCSENDTENIFRRSRWNIELPGSGTIVRGRNVRGIYSAPPSNSKTKFECAALVRDQHDRHKHDQGRVGIITNPEVNYTGTDSCE